MDAIDDARKLLTLSELDLPSPPKIVRIDVEPYMTYDGEDALQVWLILDEETTERDLKGDDLWAIEEKIHDRVAAKRLGLFPYVRFVKQSELDSIGDEDDL